MPFTTGLLIGIGETRAERVDALFAIRRVAAAVRAHPGGHHPELPRQAGHGDARHARRRTGRARRHHRGRPDRARPEDAHPGAAEPGRPTSTALLLGAGIDDWGGVSPLTPDHVNPERPWPPSTSWRAAPPTAGFALRERLTIYPEYVLRGEPWLDPRVAAHVAALADPTTGWPTRGAHAGRAALAGARRRPATSRRPHRPAHRRSTPRAAPRTGARDFDEVYGDWDELASTRRVDAPPRRRLDSDDVRRGLRLAADDPAALLEPAHHDEALALMPRATARPRRSWPRSPTTCAATWSATTSPTWSTGTSTSPTSATSAAGSARSRSGARDADAYRCRSTRSPTGPRRRGTSARPRCACRAASTPSCPARRTSTWCARSRSGCPACTCTPSRRWRSSTAPPQPGCPSADWLTELREAGLDTIPGTAAEILDDEVRWVLTKGKLPPGHLDRGRRPPRTALGIRSSSTMMYGHVDHPRHWLGHLRVLAGIQDAAPAVSPSSCRCRSCTPTRRSTWPASPARVRRWRENLAVHAMARILLHGRIDNIQTSWVKLGTDGTRAMLRRRRERPRRHADGGDHLADGRLRARVGANRRGASGGRRGGGPPGPPADHDVYTFRERGTVTESDRFRQRFGILPRKPMMQVFSTRLADKALPVGSLDR